MTNLKGVKSIAIMGGTFDPIHNGHLVTAEVVRHEYCIEKLLFVPSGQPPHKGSVTDKEHRFIMTVLATAGNKHFDTSRIEIDRQGLTYTVDTVTSLKEQCDPDTKIYFITGADAVHQILSWKDSSKLVSMCEFVAVSRPGYQNENLHQEIDNLRNNYYGRIHYIEVPSLAISSTDIRQRVARGAPIKYLLPVEVENYIDKYGIYK